MSLQWLQRTEIALLNDRNILLQLYTFLYGVYKLFYAWSSEWEVQNKKEKSEGLYLGFLVKDYLNKNTKILWIVELFMTTRYHFGGNFLHAFIYREIIYFLEIWNPWAYFLYWKKPFQKKSHFKSIFKNRYENTVLNIIVLKLTFLSAY